MFIAKSQAGQERQRSLVAIKSHLTCLWRRDLETDRRRDAGLCDLYRAFVCFLFSVFYRPHGPHELFLARFQEFLHGSLSTKLSDIVLVGDFNFPQIETEY